MKMEISKETIDKVRKILEETTVKPKPSTSESEQLAAARAMIHTLTKRLHMIKFNNPDLCIKCGEMMTDLIGHSCPDGEKDE